MNVPVKDERLGLSHNECAICTAINAHLDKIVLDLGPCDAVDVEHVLSQTVRWVAMQTLAHYDGDVIKVLNALQSAINEPQNERLVAGYLERTGQEASSPGVTKH